MEAKFITLEGGEGSGKSTQCALLADQLQSCGIDVYLTREPGGSPGAELIRDMVLKGDTDRWSPITEALLMTAARADHVEKVIKPKLAAGTWVLCDRFYHSTLAYQGIGHNLGVDKMRTLTTLAIGDFTPDLMLLLDLPVEVGMERAEDREAKNLIGEDRFERMGTSFHEAMRKGFIAIAEADPNHCMIIDADGSPEAVNGAIWDAVTSRLDLP